MEGGKVGWGPRMATLNFHVQMIRLQVRYRPYHEPRVPRKWEVGDEMDSEYTVVVNPKILMLDQAEQ